MKLHDINTTPVEVKGGQAINLQMDTTSAIGFSLSIDKLYTHKIESVIREICSNARDSMISAGRGEIPFEVFLPSVLSPYLVIKDTGLGLSKEDAVTYLSTLYKSTKTNENQSVGSYGIGSKSPFAISDSYNIETIKDGRKCAFQFFRSGRSLPQLMLLNEEDTDEPNGVTFRIHVRDVDRDDYLDALQTQLFMFNPKPLVDGLPWNLDAPKVIRHTSEYTLFRSEAHRDFFGRYAVEMGGVTYPFKPNEVDYEFDNMVSAVSRDMGSYDIMVFHMPIGEVEVPGDRERIEYSDWTKKNLKIRLEGCFKDYFQSVREGIEQVMNQFTADPLEVLEKVKLHCENNGSMIQYMINKGELSNGKHTEAIKVFSQQIMNSKGELSDHEGISFSLGQASLRDFKLKLPLGHAKKSLKRRLKDAVTGVETVEVVETIIQKYSTSNGGYDHNNNLQAFKYQDTAFFVQGEYSNKYRPTKVILIDQRDKPYLKLVNANLKPEERNNIIFVRCNGDDIDFTAFEEAFKFFKCDAELIRLSTLKMPSMKTAGGKVVPVRFSASGIRKVDIHTSNWYGQQKARNPVEKLKSEEFDDFKPEFYAFFDSNNDRLYFDAEMTKPLPEVKIDWIRRVAVHHGSKVVFLSKTTAKTLLSHYQDMGATPLSDLFDIGKCYQNLSREEKNILFNFVRFDVQTDNDFIKVYDATLDYNMRVLFDLRKYHEEQNRYYSDCYVNHDSILTFLRDSRVRKVREYKEMLPSPEFMKQMRNVLHVLLNRDRSEYVTRAIDNMARNIIHTLQKEIYKSVSVDKILISLSDRLVRKHIGELLGDVQSVDITRFLKRGTGRFGNRAFML